ncbi:ADP-ribose pyrophosphatase YjhB (NUDIX family) [Streptomonospora nanhaiensis]|uniref:ADP-ribose pyrophosphatase YjhB (NUDIX family) n=1 Tax=Streptomonospora nanhaiensis TaxID=1323731 RepID=A0A853BIK1_9ACTN|nr:NUDIX domain-containing protein [Streptomonospora nanhaiensis]NYI94431.1 ADP-ribose pyrophosphatase YjhB (NUDIX family) [Streptomonospora nanhaiensis]
MGGPSAPRRARRVTAHLLWTDPEGRAVLPPPPADPEGPPHGGEVLPGARVLFGQDPAEVARAAGGAPPGTHLVPYDVRTELTLLHDSQGALELHTDRIYYTAPLAAAPAAPGGRRVPPRAAVALPALPAAADLAEEEPARTGRSLRRLAAYGVVTDPAGRLLLSLIAPGFPGENTWHLPGGGVDHGENPRAALRREIAEETDQDAGVGGLITITHHHSERRPDPHTPTTETYAVWTFFHAHVAEPGTPRVTEVEGSTADCAWFAPEDLAAVPLSRTAQQGLAAVARAAGVSG